MTSHDPTEDQRIAAVVREHFTAHERSQEPAIMQNTVDTNTATVRELTPEQLIALSNDELFNIITPKREREPDQHAPEATIREPVDEHRDEVGIDNLATDLRKIADHIELTRCACTSLLGRVVARAARLDRRTIAEALEIVGRAALVADGVHRLERHELRGLKCSVSVESQSELAPEAAPARAPRSHAVKLARRVGIVFAWLLLIAVAVAVCTAAQVSVVLGQHALVEDGIAPLAAAGVAAICSIVVGLGALAVLGKLADKLAEIEP